MVEILGVGNVRGFFGRASWHTYMFTSWNCNDSLASYSDMVNSRIFFWRKKMTDEISNLRKELYALKSSVAFEDGSNFAQFRDMVVKLNAINEKLDKKLDEVFDRFGIQKPPKN